MAYCILLLLGVVSASVLNDTCPRAPCRRSGFVHIPKTGGGTIAEYIGSHCKNASNILLPPGGHETHIRHVLQTARRAYTSIRDPADREIGVYQFAFEYFGNPNVNHGQNHAPPGRHWTIGNLSQLLPRDGTGAAWNWYDTRYSAYWKDVSLDDPRVNVMCMERGLDFGVSDMMQRDCPGTNASAVALSNVHQSHSKERADGLPSATYNMTCELRRALYQRQAADLRIYRHFCGSVHDATLTQLGCSLDGLLLEDTPNQLASDAGYSTCNSACHRHNVKLHNYVRHNISQM